MKTDLGQRFGNASWAVMLALITLAAFSNAAHDAFVYDDKFFAQDVAALDLQTVFRLFKEDAWAGTGTPSDVYRPLLLLSILGEHALHGGRAIWFHITNIALHIATTLVLFGLLLEVLRNRPFARLSAFFAALIFGLHPIHTEAVNSIFNRSEILATLAVLGALWSVLRDVETNPRRAFSIAALLYFVALLCRESAASLPLLLLLMLAFLRPQLLFDRRNWRRLWPAISLIVVVAGYLLLRRLALPGRLDDVPVAKIVPQNFAHRLGMALTMLREGLRLLFVPHPLRANYDAFGAGGPLHALLIHALILMSAIMTRRSAPGFLLGLGFYYLAMLPSTRLLTSGAFSVTLGERYLYLPSVGLSLGLAMLLPQLCATIGTRAVSIAGSVIAVLFFAGTGARNVDWHSDLALWQAESRVAPNSGNSWRYLTGAQIDARRYADAARICDEQLSRHGDFGKLQMHCAIAYEQLYRDREAETAYRRAIELGMGAVGHGNLGRFLANTGRRPEAEREYLAAIDSEPVPARQHHRRGQYLLRFHPERRSEAALEFQRALDAQPRFAAARSALDALQKTP